MYMCVCVCVRVRMSIRAILSISLQFCPFTDCNMCVNPFLLLLNIPQMPKTRVRMGPRLILGNFRLANLISIDPLPKTN